MPTRAAFARPGPVVSRSPSSSLLCSPPTPLPPSASAMVPLAFGLPRRGRCSSRVTRASTDARPSGSGHRLPAAPVLFEERHGPPRFLGRPLHARRDQTLRRLRRRLANHDADAAAFWEREPLGTPGGSDFGALPTAAHVLACLRIAAESVALDVARFATGLPGCGFDRAGFAPAGRQTAFHEVIIITSLLADQPFLVTPRSRSRSRSRSRLLALCELDQHGGDTLQHGLPSGVFVLENQLQATTHVECSSAFGRGASGDQVVAALVGLRELTRTFRDVEDDRDRRAA